ncbi:MAG: CBS domain-containing protein [Alphaproteobacteria bacterium]|nr:CBS domain-containing protein [Alphaproteobacteria bacterium]
MIVAEVLRRKGAQIHKIRDFESVAEAVRALAAARIGALVVIDRKGDLAGMFSERDVVHALDREGPAALGHTVERYMTARVTTCKPNDRIDQVLAVMTVSRIRHVPVVADSRLLGLVSIGDLVKFRLDEKEQETNVLLDITRSHI